MNVFTNLFNMGGLIEWGLEGLENVLNYILLWFNDVVFSLVASLYEIFFAFIKLDIINNFDALNALVDRVMLLTGLLMLFRLVFSFLTYLVSPDQLFDSGKGVGKVITNALIVVALLAAINPMFDFIYEFQTVLVEDNIMSRIILGTDEGIEEQQEGVTLGQQMTYMSWIPFFIYIPDGNDLSQNISCMQHEGDVCRSARNGVASAILGGVAMDDFMDVIQDGKDSIKTNSLLSLVAGIFLICILLSFIIDIGVRAFKLVFLQMIAPIPIILYIEPKKQSALTTWLKMVGTTFADLFIRIAIMLLAIVLISNIQTMISASFDDLHGLTWAIAYLLLYVSIFVFAKMIPKLLGDLLGFDGGGIELNPFKKAGFGALTGGIVGGAVGSVTGSIAGAAGAVARGKGFKGAAAAGIGGFFAGGARGIKSGASSKDLKGVIGNAGKGIKNQAAAREKRATDGGVVKRTKGAVLSSMGAGAKASASAAALNKSRAANRAIAGLAGGAKSKTEKIANKRFGVSSKDAFISSKTANQEEALKSARKRMAEYTGNLNRNADLEAKIKERDQMVRNMTPEQIEAWQNYNSPQVGEYSNSVDAANASLAGSGYNEEFEKLNAMNAEIEAMGGDKGYYESQSEINRLEADIASKQQAYDDAQAAANKEYADEIAKIEQQARSGATVDATEADDFEIIRSSIDAMERQSSGLGDYGIDLDSMSFSGIEDIANKNIEKIELDENYKKDN